MIGGGIRAVKAGRNLFKLDESIRNYCGHLRDLAHGHKTTDAAPTERTRLAAAQADAIELKNARARGTLVDSEAVAREWEGIFHGDLPLVWSPDIDSEFLSHWNPPFHSVLQIRYPLLLSGLTIEC
jgi:hypothetical protein